VPEDDPTQSNMTTTLDPSQVWPVVVHLFRPVSLEIDVVDWLNRPVTTGGSIVVTPQGSTAQTFTLPASGHLSIATVNTIAVRPDKNYTVAPTIPGQTIASKTQLGAPAYSTGTYTSVFQFQLPAPPAVQLTINVVDSLGIAKANVPVTLTGGPGNVSLPGSSNALGVVKFSVVPDLYIVYTVRAVAGATWSATNAPITVTPPQTTFTFALAPPPAPVPVDQTITVLSPLGVPVGNLTVTFTGGPSSVSLTGITQAVSGAVTFSVAPDVAVPYVAHVLAAAGWAAADRPITVATLSTPFVLQLVAP
jgi:hypothetical protein